MAPFISCSNEFHNSHKKMPVIDKVRVIRNSPKFKEKYKKRATIERFFSAIKRTHRLLAEVRNF